MSQPEELTAAELATLLKRDGTVQLVDVRETWEAELAALPGAMLLPLARLPELTTALDPDQPIVLYCHHGIRSAQAAGYLMHVGFSDVRHLAGGIDAWAEHVDPTMRRY